VPVLVHLQAESVKKVLPIVTSTPRLTPSFTRPVRDQRRNCKIHKRNPLRPPAGLTALAKMNAYMRKKSGLMIFVSDTSGTRTAQPGSSVWGGKFICPDRQVRPTQHGRHGDGTR